MTTLFTEESVNDSNLFGGGSFKQGDYWVEVVEADFVELSKQTPEDREKKYRYDKTDFINLSLTVMKGQAYGNKRVWRKIKFQKSPEEVYEPGLKDGETIQSRAEKDADNDIKLLKQLWKLNGRTGGFTLNDVHQLVGCVAKARLYPRGDSGNATLGYLHKDSPASYAQEAAMNGTTEVDDAVLPF